jgi:transcriptional regulator with XRE-family HTH domain
MDWTKINPLELPSLPLEKRQDFPMRPVIYFCIKGDTVLYIGQSQNLYYRWRGHHRYCQLVKEKNVVVHWLECVDGHKRVKMEKIFIKRYKPSLNVSPIYLKVALKDGNKLHRERQVFHNNQNGSCVNKHQKLFAQMLSRFNISARDLAAASNISEVMLSRFRCGKADLGAAKFLALIAVIPEPAKNWYLSELQGTKSTTSLRLTFESAPVEEKAEVLRLVADMLIGDTRKNISDCVTTSSR